MNRLASLSVTFLLLAFNAPAQMKSSPLSGSDSPLTVEVKQDVEVTHEIVGGQERGKLYFDTPASKGIVIKKGSKFEMLAVLGEGGCRIRFQGREYGLASCPWLPGFRDHQVDVFRIR